MVLGTLLASFSYDGRCRAPAEAQLRAWETDATPGFLASLMQIVGQAAAVDEVRRDDGGGQACKNSERARARRHTLIAHRKIARAATGARRPPLARSLVFVRPGVLSLSQNSHDRSLFSSPPK